MFVTRVKIKSADLLYVFAALSKTAPSDRFAAGSTKNLRQKALFIFRRNFGSGLLKKQTVKVLHNSSTSSVRSAKFIALWIIQWLQKKLLSYCIKM